ncbi:hypothetical protein ACJMK2_022700 [Sinanodonta woodiana]|uniref:Uncharacterized protein n=1 Tax=Sinanodonta woodiana TaxID=1069815 RepID=A0ABD3TK06_SINWO
MKFFGLPGLILLILVVKDVLSVCPKSGCKCGESCVDDNNRWCNSDNDRDCSCKKGCLIFDTLLNPDDFKSIYCRSCFCSETSTDGRAWCSKAEWCKPTDKTLFVDYPNEDGENPPCGDENIAE